MATRTKKRTAKKAPARKAAAKRSAPKKVQPIPAGYHSVTPYLCIDGAARAIEFYKKAFGAKERMRMEAPGGKIGHAEITIGDSIIMMADEYPEMEFRSPRARGGTPVTLHIYVKNVDQAFPRAIEAGATVKQPLKNQFYGDRSGTLEDPFGHIWHLSTHVEELSMKEIRKRGEEAMKGG
jgi:PhnB protein